MNTCSVYHPSVSGKEDLRGNKAAPCSGAPLHGLGLATGNEVFPLFLGVDCEEVTTGGHGCGLVRQKAAGVEIQHEEGHDHDLSEH